MLPIFLSLALSLPLWGSPGPEGKVVHGATYTGVIFTASMARASKSEPFWIEHGKVTYWTPSPQLVDEAELTFSRAVREANQKIPPGGFHFGEYYTPKYYSLDRERPLPADVYSNEFYDWSPEEAASELRQYVGVTVGGKRALLINFFAKEYFVNDDANQLDWKREWVEMCPETPKLYFVSDTGKLCSYPF